MCRMLIFYSENVNPYTSFVFMPLCRTERDFFGIKCISLCMLMLNIPASLKLARHGGGTYTMSML